MNNYLKGRIWLVYKILGAYLLLWEQKIAKSENGINIKDSSL